MTAIILNEFTKPFYQKYFCWFIAIILAANAAMCVVFIERQNTEFWQLPDGEYADRVDAVCAGAEKNKERLLRLDATEHDYSYRYQDAVIDRYASLRDTVEIEPDFVHDGWTIYFGYTFFSVFAALGAVVIVSSVIIYDRGLGMWAITRTAKNGRGRIFVAKIITVFSLAFMTAILCQLTALMLVYIRKGLASPLADLQNIPAFYLSGCSGSILSFLILTMLYRAAIIGGFALAAAAAASFFNGYFALVLTGAVIFISGYSLSLLPIATTWRYLNFYEALSLESFFGRYETVNFLGRPIEILYANTAVLCVMLAVCVLLITVGLAMPKSRGVNVILKRQSLRLPSLHSGRSLSLVSHELYKILSPKVVFALVVCVAVQAYIDFGELHSKEPYRETALREYASQLANMSVDERKSYAANEILRCSDIVNAEKDMTDRYFGGEISSKEFSEYTHARYEAQAKLEPLLLLNERLQYLDTVYNDKGIRASLAFDYDFEKLLLGSFSIGMYISIVLFACTTASVDYRRQDAGGFAEILSTLKHGREKTMRLKLKVVIAASIIFSLLFSGLNLIIYGLSDASGYFGIALLSFPDFVMTDSGITIGIWLVLEQLIRTLLCCALGISCFILTYLIRNTLYGYIAVLAVTLLPELLLRTGLGFFEYISVVMLLSGSRLYRLSSEILSFDYLLVLIYLAVIAAAVVFAVRKCLVKCEHNC